LPKAAPLRDDAARNLSGRLFSMTITKVAAAAALLLAALLAPPFSKPSQAQTIVSAENPAAIAALIQVLGFQARLDKDSVGDPLIHSSAGGVDFSVYFYGCTKNKRCQSIQFSAGYNLTDGSTPEVIDEWNQTKRFASAYLDDENDPFLQMDVNTEGGITEENFNKSFDLWETLKAQFEEHIGFDR
jgi:hypothetical protein